MVASSGDCFDTGDGWWILAGAGAAAAAAAILAVWLSSGALDWAGTPGIGAAAGLGTWGAKSLTGSLRVRVARDTWFSGHPCLKAFKGGGWSDFDSKMVDAAFYEKSFDLTRVVLPSLDG